MITSSMRIMEPRGCTCNATNAAVDPCSEVPAVASQVARTASQPSPSRSAAVPAVQAANGAIDAQRAPVPGQPVQQAVAAS